MRGLVQSYMAYVRGERSSPLWNVLAPAGLATRFGAGLLDFLFRHGLRRRVPSPLPLISVGNLTYGGTNKTPFVEMLARRMGELGIKAGVVSRGYTGRAFSSAGSQVLVLRDGEGNRDVMGDEPILLSRRLPGVFVAVARRRIDGIRALQAEGVELAIADDAFQHRALDRDVDIVLIDAACPFGSGRLVPAGILREPVSALARARLVVLTKASQASPEALSELRGLVERFVPPERVFTSHLRIDDWFLWYGAPCPCEPPEKGLRVMAFSAIGNPESFLQSLRDAGLQVVGERRFRDHHRYGKRELRALTRAARAAGAEALACTEKDLYNLPLGWSPDLPLFVPSVTAALDEPDHFFRALAEVLRPRLVVASNGYGEDAIGVLLARRLRERFPSAEVLAFPLVGRGDAYLQAGFPVSSARSVTPSGGVVKYRLRDLWGDMRAGLLRHVGAQLQDWERLSAGLRSPLCVGDVYLLLQAIWGSGARPLFVATAKTVYLSGHWRLERALIRRLTLRAWTRDPETAEQLNLGRTSGAEAVYAGSPIMDLLGDAPIGSPPEPPRAGDSPLILLLPGSRLRAYQDVNLLLDAVLLLHEARPCAFRMVLAPTIPTEEMVQACKGWGWGGGTIERGGLSIPLTSAPIAEAAQGAALLLGLGGTANQLCAGLGIPVLSIDEKGKRVQKRLLGDAELLVPASAKALAEGAQRILGDPKLYRLMGEAGHRRMGRPGAAADMVDYAAETLGWDLRERLYERLRPLVEVEGNGRGEG